MDRNDTPHGMLVGIIQSIEDGAAIYDANDRLAHFNRMDGSWVRIDCDKLPGGGTFVVTADITQSNISRKEIPGLRMSRTREKFRVKPRTVTASSAPIGCF